MTSISEIRSRFPSLERLHNGFPVAYFDGPGGTQVSRQVVDAMTNYLFHHNANTHWDYPTSAETDEIIEHGRGDLADFLNAKPSEIVFGPNMTSLTFHVSRALGKSWGPDDEIVVTELDHHANVAPWKRLESERGVKVHKARMIPETGELDWDDLERLIGSKTRLVAIGAASNALGTINDLARARDLARAPRALVFVDAVHFAPHSLVDVNAIDCDFLVCSPYKFYGPHQGVLYGRQALLEEVDFPKLEPAPDTAPERGETGTQNHEGIAGSAAAVEMLASFGEGRTRREKLDTTFRELHARGEALFEKMWSGLSSVPGLRLFGLPPGKARTPTVSFVFEAAPSAEVAKHLAAQGVFVSHGDFYAKTVVERLGVSEVGLVRAGCACYTTEDEVERLVEGMRGM
jgi:cysteine desulfurase family protein (TIGR01976 family)